MIDLEHHFGRGEKFVSYDELMRIMEMDKVEVAEGDLVCFRTGYDRVILGMNKRPEAAVLEQYPCAALDGRDERLLNWITRSGVVALISDNRAVEASPSRPCEEDHCASLPLHAHCLFKLGVYLGEIWHLSELADWLRQPPLAFPVDRPTLAPPRRRRLPRQRRRHRLANPDLDMANHSGRQIHRGSLIWGRAGSSAGPPAFAGHR